MVGLLPFTGNPGVVPIVILTAATLVSAILLRGWLSHTYDALRQSPGDGTPDACWKYGLFYFNPDDSALFVERRVGIGYTINFAHASAWIVIALTLLVPLGGVFFALSQQR